MKAHATHELPYTLSAESVDNAGGILKGVTVLKSGVQAKGKFVSLDANGDVTYVATQTKTKVPVFTDEETLQTLMGAAQDAGGRVKVRSDHDDSLDARAGYATNFRRMEDRVICDIYLNLSYRDRAIVLETAQKTPELIGCSIDFIPTFSIANKKAMMRVSDLSAVDIVDEGAVTPAGLFMRAGVDSAIKEVESDSVQPDHLTIMSKDAKTPPTIEECMALITEHASKMAEFSSTLASLKTAPAAAPASMSAEVDSLKLSLAAEKTAREQLAKAQSDFIADQTAKMATIAKERNALGLSAAGAAPLAASAEQEAERVRLAADKSNQKPKTYLELVADARAGNVKLRASEAHHNVMASHPTEYRQYQQKLGIISSHVS